MTDAEQQDTRESDALARDAVLGDPPNESPIGADRRGADAAPGAPIGPIVGAFVGAFAAAKVLKRLGGGND